MTYVSIMYQYWVSFYLYRILINNIYNNIYFFGSFIFLIGRIVTIVLLAGRINNKNNMILSLLPTCPESTNVEVTRSNFSERKAVNVVIPWNYQSYVNLNYFINLLIFLYTIIIRCFTDKKANISNHC